MKIMSFNIQNDMKKASTNKIEAIVELIKTQEPDVIGMQELTFFVKTELQKKLPEYNFYGRSRYGINTFFDEYNCILTKRNIEVIETSTFSLGKKPYKVRSKNLLSFFPRICTTIVCVLDRRKIKIANTHLDHGFDRTKEYQLSVLYEVLKNTDYPLLLMGDFNMYPGNDNFKSFKVQMGLVDIAEDLGRTCKLSEGDRPIDHILINNQFSFSKVDKLRNDISDHFPIVCDIELKK